MKHPQDRYRFPDFRARLRELQGDRSNVEFAAFLGMSRQTIGFYLNGDRIPDILALRQIAERCNVSSDWLLGLSDVKDPDGTLQQVCRYTGLNAQSVQFLHDNIAWRDEDGRYRGGFSEDDCNPKRLLDDFFQSSRKQIFITTLCRSINTFIEGTLNGFFEDSEREEQSNRCICEIHKKYGALGIVGVPLQIYTMFEMSESRKAISDFFQEWGSTDIADAIERAKNERSDPDAPQE